LLLIDDQVVVDSGNGSDDASGLGQVELAGGAHSFELRYNWNGGSQVFDLYWQPPGEQMELMPPGVFITKGGAWLPGTVTGPPAYRLDEGQ
jgi:hypothetical protein